MRQAGSRRSSPKQSMFEDAMKPKARIDVENITKKADPGLRRGDRPFIGQETSGETNHGCFNL